MAEQRIVDLPDKLAFVLEHQAGELPPVSTGAADVRISRGHPTSTFEADIDSVGLQHLRDFEQHLGASIVRFRKPGDQRYWLGRMKPSKVLHAGQAPGGGALERVQLTFYDVRPA